MQSRQVKRIKFGISASRRKANLIVLPLELDLSWSCSGNICPRDETIVEHFKLDVNFANG